MTWSTLTFERDGPVGRVWLQRPERRNALDQTTLEELAALFGELERAFDLRVVVIGGRGKSFCAGADLKAPPGVARMLASDASVRERRWLSDLGTRAIEAIERLDAITIARIHGHAIGGGLLLALACDLRIAAADAQFGIPEVELGDVLNWKGVPRLVAEAGMTAARRVVLLGERFDAAAAERYGIITQVVAPDALDDAVDDWSRRIAGKPEASVTLSKAQFRAFAKLQSTGDTRELESVLELEALRSEAARASFGGS